LILFICDYHLPGENIATALNEDGGSALPASANEQINRVNDVLTAREFEIMTL